MTLAERPYPFPSRTRKSSSPAPKILRGQPFGKIGRRRDFCVSRGNRSGPRIALDRQRVSLPADDRLRPATSRQDARHGGPGGDRGHLPVPHGVRRTMARVHARARAPLHGRDPAAILAAEKQRRLCLTAEHRDLQHLPGGAGADGRRRGFGHDARPTVARHRDRRGPRRSSSTTAGWPSASRRCAPTERRQGGLVALMAVAFAAIVIARLSSGGPESAPAQVGVGPSASPSAAPARRRAPRQVARRRAMRRRGPSCRPRARRPTRPPARGASAAPRRQRDLQGPQRRHPERDRRRVRHDRGRSSRSSTASRTLAAAGRPGPEAALTPALSAGSRGRTTSRSRRP